MNQNNKIGKECLNCGKKGNFSYTYYCNKCKKEMAGQKPRKSRDLCSGCRQDWYNYNRAGRVPNKDEKCWSYTNSKIKLKNVYHSTNTVVPSVRWKLDCYT